MSSGYSGSRNAPAQQPPCDIMMKPSVYLPPEQNAHRSEVATLRAPPDPGKPSEVRGFETEVSQQEGREETGSTPVLKLREDGEVEGNFTRHISETCKFSPEEGERLITLRKQLLRVSAEYSTLIELLASDHSGLPHIRETHRNRLAGDTYSVQDARRELQNEWFSEKLKSYRMFIDKALLDELDPKPEPGRRSRTEETPPGTPAKTLGNPASPQFNPLSPSRTTADFPLKSMPAVQPFQL